MSDRETVLQRIRQRLKVSERAGAVDERLQQRPLGPVPARACGDAATLRERFVERAEAASAEVRQPPRGEPLPTTLADLVAGADGEIVTDEALRAEWRGGAGRAVCRRARPEDALAVSAALCGVAETGTLVLASGPGRPITAAFLPPVHVAAVDAADIVGGYEAAWERVRAAGAWPRAVTWITGPSRSADIEQTLNLGAHGPLRLIIVLRNGQEAFRE